MSEAVALSLAEPAAATAEPPAPLLGPRWAVVGIFLLLLVAGLAYARAFLMPVVLAVLLQMVFTPVRRALERIGLPAALSASLIVLSLLGVLVAAVVTLTAPVSGWVDQAPTIGRQLEQKLSELRGATEGVIEAAEQVNELTTNAGDPDVQRVVLEDSGSVVSMAMTVPSALAQLVFTLVLLFFMLSSGDMFYEKIVHVLPSFKDKVRAIRIARDIERALSHYLFTITVINAGLGFAIAIAMWLIGMPNPALLGAMGFLLNFIPYMGALLGVVVTAVVAIVSLDHVSQAVLAAAVYFALTSVEGQLLTPYFVGRRLRLNTVVVFLSVTLFAWLWSVVGMLVATPLLVMVRIFCEHIPVLSGLGDFLSERGAEREDEGEAGTAA